MVVIEQASEVDRIIAACQTLGASPLLGIRAKLSSRSTGRWGSSVGERAKFGLDLTEMLQTVSDALALVTSGNAREESLAASTRAAGANTMGDNSSAGEVQAAMYAEATATRGNE